ncbi:MAG: hemolysin III family protein [Desulfobacterales bacterium]|nr:hemolysin III family protein [Desulfobacterales bacterium]
MFSPACTETPAISSALRFSAAPCVLLYTASTPLSQFPQAGFKTYIQDSGPSPGIYLLIAGTYTPFLLGNIAGIYGMGHVCRYLVFDCIWASYSKIFFVHRFKIVSTIAYILMGWIVIFAIKPLFHALPGAGLALLVCGGLAYTLGTIFFTPRKKYRSIMPSGIYSS